MKITTSPLEDHQIKMIVEIDQVTLDDAKRRTARKLSQRVKIPGFRPGKAPYQIIVRQLGDNVILEESIELLANEIYPKAIDEIGIKPSAPGALDQIANYDPVVLEFKIPLQAEVEIGDYHSIYHPYTPDDVKEEEVETVLQNLRERGAILEPVDRSSQEGDVISIKISAKRKDAEQDAGNMLLKEQTSQILILSESENKTDEWPFPGFSRFLLGFSKGENSTKDYTFPDSSPFENLRGMSVEFAFHIEEVKSRSLPELNDEFASTVGDFSTLDALKDTVKLELGTQIRNTYNKDYDDIVLKELISTSTFRYPSQMLEKEIDDVIHQLEHRLEEQKLSMDLYLKSRQMDEQSLRDDVRPVAEERLKRSLLISELAKIENVQVDQKQVEQETMRTFNIITQGLSDKEIRKMSNKDVIGNLYGNVMIDLVTQQTLAKLREITSTKQEVSDIETINASTDLEQPSISDTQMENNMEQEESIESNEVKAISISDQNSTTE